jgi:hypothetical protein
VRPVSACSPYRAPRGQERAEVAPVSERTSRLLSWSLTFVAWPFLVFVAAPRIGGMGLRGPRDAVQAFNELCVMFNVCMCTLSVAMRTVTSLARSGLADRDPVGGSARAVAPREGARGGR